MKDNDQTANPAALIDAGVRSFKIEGRYKDMSYVKKISPLTIVRCWIVLLKTAAISRVLPLGAPNTSSCRRPIKRSIAAAPTILLTRVRGDIGAFDSPKFIGLPVGEVLKVGKDYLDVEVTDALTNGDGLNVMIKREVVGFRANTVEKTGEKSLSRLAKRNAGRPA